MNLTLDARKKLNNGSEIPILGLGVWQMAQGVETESAVTWALTSGYRHIDTATLYRNEESVGEAIKRSGIPREEVFLATKLWPTDAFDVEAAFEASMQKLDLGYIDLYLIHWPVPLLGGRTWKKMEELYDQKLARAIGVSNYSISQIEELLRGANTPPTINQIEMNPFAYERDLIEFCEKNDIAVEAYSPLTRGVRLDDETVRQNRDEPQQNPSADDVALGSAEGRCRHPQVEQEGAHRGERQYLRL
jgi:diketogulonate reductase-like aldo/keto reductase